jgi:SET family sugar efflux transporter-like MFS transporter
VRAPACDNPGPRMSALRKLADVARIPAFARLSVTALVLGLAYSITLPYLSLFALTEARMSARELGVYMALSAVSGVVVTTWLGKLSDRGLGHKRAILLSLVCALLGHAAMSQLRSFAGLLVNTVVFLSVGRAAFSQTFSLARSRFEAGGVRDLTLATNALRMFFSLAWVIGPAFGAAAVAEVKFSGLFLVSAGLFGLVALLVLPVDASRADLAFAGKRTAVLQYMRRPEVAAMTAGFALLFMCANLNTTVLPLHVVDTLHGAKSEVGWVFGTAAALELPLMLGSALVANRLGKPRMLIAAAAVYGAYFLAMTAAGRPWQLYPVQVLSALVISIVMGLGLSYFQDLLPGEPGVSTALYANAMTLGSVLSGSVFAAAAGACGTRGLLLVCAGCSFGACLLLLYAGRRGSAAPS